MSVSQLAGVATWIVQQVNNNDSSLQEVIDVHRMEKCVLLAMSTQFLIVDVTQP